MGGLFVVNALPPQRPSFRRCAHAHPSTASSRRPRYDGGMADEHDDLELISRLRVIESQPLSERAAAYAALHDELARTLESGPADVQTA